MVQKQVSVNLYDVHEYTPPLFFFFTTFIVYFTN